MLAIPAPPMPAAPMVPVQTQPIYNSMYYPTTYPKPSQYVNSYSYNINSPCPAYCAQRCMHNCPPHCCSGYGSSYRHNYYNQYAYQRHKVAHRSGAPRPGPMKRVRSGHALLKPCGGGVPTLGGNSRGNCCIFPFIYKGIVHRQCTFADATDSWCSTTSNYDKDRKWGLCV